MNRTTRVIQVLDESHNGSIEYQNWDWLSKNVEKLNIFVCVGDCIATIFDVIDNFGKEGTRVIQSGIDVPSGDRFNPQKEALLLTKYKEGFMVFLYPPNRKELGYSWYT